MNHEDTNGTHVGPAAERTAVYSTGFDVYLSQLMVTCFWIALAVMLNWLLFGYLIWEVVWKAAVT